VTATPFTGSANLYPGSGSQSGTSTVTNTNTGVQHLGVITATIADPTLALGHSGPNACTTGDFALSAASGWSVAVDGLSATYTVDADEAGTSPGPAGAVTTPSLTISMRNLNQDQNDCQGSSPNVTYTVS
jgi:hypothetical protein